MKIIYRYYDQQQIAMSCRASSEEREIPRIIVPKRRPLCGLVSVELCRDAGKIIQHCRENSDEIEAQPFANAVIGTITEITEEYFLVDDSSLCKDPKDGITYKVLLNDIRISRYVQKNYVKVGDMVEVLYRDQIDEVNEHTIREATSALKVTIIDGKAYIFE